MAGSLLKRDLNAAPISQVTLIIAFALDANERCPQPMREEPTSAGGQQQGYALAPHEISFDEVGVSAVFKRLYEPYCELQILFERPLGETLLTTFEEHSAKSKLAARRRGGSSASSTGGITSGSLPSDAEYDALSKALPLALLLRICRRVIASPTFADERELLAALRRPAPNDPPDAALFRIRIAKADGAGRVLLPAAGETRAKKAAGLALLRGDALVSPHYRLGVGVNHAFDTLPHLSNLLQSAWGRGGRAALRNDPFKLLEEWEGGSGTDAEALANHQLSVIYLEERCKLLVFGGRAFERDRQSRTLRELGQEELSRLDC